MFEAGIFTNEAGIHSWITKKVHENRLDDPIVTALYEIVTQQL